MRISSLFSHHNAPPTAVEPVLKPLALKPSYVPGPQDEPLADTEYADAGEAERGNAVFDVIGLASSVDESRRKRGAASGPVDVIDALYAQYCLALDDPHAAVASNWVAQSVPPEGRHGAAAQGHDSVRATESIETLLSGTQLMEHAFGPLGLGEARELIASEPVPEILRLFAPGEYQAAASRRPSTLPPALARREHHSVSIDSAMPAPQAVSHQDDNS